MIKLGGWAKSLWRGRLQWLEGTRGRALAWGLVAGQFLLLFLIVFGPSDGVLWRHTSTTSAIALVLGVTGIALMAASALHLGRGLSPLPRPNASAQLRTDGLYAFVRHPLYTGLMLFAFGAVVGSGSGWRLFWFVALVGWLYAKTRVEEATLWRRFGEYVPYQKRVPRFFPRLWPRRSAPDVVDVRDMTPAAQKQSSAKS